MKAALETDCSRPLLLLRRFSGLDMRPYLASTKLRSRYRLPPLAPARPPPPLPQQQEGQRGGGAGLQHASLGQQQQEASSSGAAERTVGGTAAERFLYDLYAVVVHRGTFQAGAPQLKVMLDEYAGRIPFRTCLTSSTSMLHGVLLPMRCRFGAPPRCLRCCAGRALRGVREGLGRALVPMRRRLGDGRCGPQLWVSLWLTALARLLTALCVVRLAPTELTNKARC